MVVLANAKRCPDCPTILPPSSRGRCASCRDGARLARDRRFKAKLLRQRRAARSLRERRLRRLAEKQAARGESKRCARCRVVLGAAMFTRSRQNADGLFNYCRDCTRAADKVYRLRVGGVACACGVPKSPTARACEGCTWLDGADATEGAAIEALRDLGGEGTIDAVVLEMGVSERQVWRALGRLGARGRVRVRRLDIINAEQEPATYVLVDGRR